MGVRFRAVVLAAGYGKRLRPLTDWLPKPLLPVAGKPIVLHTLEALAAAGCEAVALNLHHLGEPIRRRLGDRVGEMPLSYSEEPEILGTLGALYPLREFLAPAEVALVVNGDSLCRWPIRGLLRRHQKTGAEATFLISRRADPKRFAGPVGVDRKGRLVCFRTDKMAQDVRASIYAGAHAFSPTLLEGLGPGKADLIADLYSPLLVRGGHLETYTTRRRWHDLGTPRRYLEGTRDWIRGEGLGRTFRRSSWGPKATIDGAADVSRSVVERDAIIERGATVERSLILPGGHVREGCRVRDSILGFETELPQGSVIEHRLVTPERADAQPRDVDSVVGGLVYSPMEAG